MNKKSTAKAEVAPSPRFRPYPEYRDSGVMWLGEIPAHWAVDRFKRTVVECQNGLWGAEPDGLNDVVCVRVADFNRITLRVDLSDPTRRSIDKQALRGRLLKPGDLLLEKSGGGENQPVGAVVSFEHTEPAVCSNFVARMQIAEGFNGRYLTFLHAAAYASRLNTRAIKQNTGIQNLDSTTYLDEVAALPPLHEQIAIAAFVERETQKLNALIDKKERLIELLQEKRTALIIQAVTKGLDPSAPMKGSGVEWLGEVPVHWEVRPLKDLFHLLDHKRIPLSSEERYPMEKSYPYYGASGVIDHVEEYIFSETLLLIAEDGANLLLRSTPIAFVAKGSFWVNNHAHVLRALAEPIEYWEAVLQIFDYTPLITGAAQPKLTKESLRAIALPVPPENERRMIVAELAGRLVAIDQLQGKIAQAMNTLRELRAAIISAAVTGKIDVRGEAT